MTNIKIFDDSKIKSFIKDEEVLQWSEKIKGFKDFKSDFLGWIDLPINYDKKEFERIKLAAEKIRNDSQVLIVIGIGGPYLAARAPIEILGNDPPVGRAGGKVQIYFAGNNLSSKYLSDLLNKIEGKEVSLNVISKSGTTTETTLAFKILREWMEKKYGDEANKRIYVGTDKEKGVLKKLATEKGYETFMVPDDIGGRYSVLTMPQLLSMAVAGINIDELMRGGIEARENFSSENLLENEAYRYAVYRNILYGQGKLVEILATWEPNLYYLGEWWKQLFGESEGKDKKGIFPAAVTFTTDLHSMGQYIQDGNRILFETVISIEEDTYKMVVEKNEIDSDGLNYLAGKTIDEINKKAMEGTIAAHVEGGVPNLILRLPKLDAFNLGYLFYFFEKACAMSGYLLGVNPFNQPGVEIYKKNMFKLLGKPEV